MASTRVRPQVTVQRPVRPGTYAIVTMGCPKNSADSETIEARLLDAGMVPARRAAEAAVVVINTCGFIESARRESIDTLLGYATAKRPGQRVIGAGCLTGRHGAEVARGIPELDAVVGVEAWDEIAALVTGDDGTPQPGWMPAPGDNRIPRVCLSEGRRRLLGALLVLRDSEVQRPVAVQATRTDPR